jgi:hypothetical protein
METHGSVDAEEAAAALASVQRSRARVAWSGYPAWYWLTTGACLGALMYTTLLPGWSATVLSALVAVPLLLVARAACRARGVCEGWIRSAMRRKEAVLLYGPVAVVILASAAAARFGSWSSPWPSIVAGVLVGVLFAGTGLTLSARADRR